MHIDVIKPCKVSLVHGVDRGRGVEEIQPGGGGWGSAAHEVDISKKNSTVHLREYGTDKVLYLGL